VSKLHVGRALAALMMVLALPGTSNLVAQSRAKIGVGGGISVPIGDFGDAVKTGWHGQVMATFNLPALPFGIRIDGQYSEFKSEAPFLGSDFKNKLLTGLVGVEVPIGPPGAPARPYLVGGVGITNTDISFDNSSLNADSETKFTAAGGVGVNIALGGFSLFGEARIFNIFTDSTDATYFPITVGLSFGGK